MEKYDNAVINRVSAEHSNFSAPPGYKRIKRTVPIPQLANVGVNGKILWRISTPATLPIEVLRGINLANLTPNKSILQHSGIDYELSAEVSDELLLIPNGEGYTLSSDTAVLSLSFRPQLNAETLMKRSESITEDSYDKVFNVPTRRHNLDGLRMHYRPIGVIAHTETDKPTANEYDVKNRVNRYIEPAFKKQKIGVNKVRKRVKFSETVETSENSSYREPTTGATDESSQSRKRKLTG